MKKLQFTLITFLSTFSIFSQADSSQIAIDSSKYDFQTSMQITKNGNVNDTVFISRKIERNASIFVEGKSYVYNALIIDSTNNIVSKTKIKLEGTNKRWPESKKTQMAMNIFYERAFNDSINLSYLNDNSTCCEWQDSVETGIIENVERFWIHPIRQNQFELTEIAGFPSVTLPLSFDNKWSYTVSITGWGEWINTTVLNKYSVLSMKNYMLNNELISCWEIQCLSDFKGKLNEHVFLYNEKYGFVSMKYKFYNGTKITFEMIETFTIQK